MTDPNETNEELSLDELKDVSGGLKGDEQCEDKMGQAKAFRKMENHPTWTKKSDNWSGIEMQENNSTINPS